ncbi:MAG: O-antigen ligase family protein [Dehalococcoidia bacterium]
MLTLEAVQAARVATASRQRVNRRQQLLGALAPTLLLTYFVLTPQPAFARNPFMAAVGHQIVTGAALLLWLTALLVRRRLPGSLPFLLPLFLVLTAQAASTIANTDRRLGLEPSLNLLSVILLFCALCDAPGLSVAALRRAVMLTALIASLVALHSVWGAWQDWLAVLHAVPRSGSPLLPPTIPRINGVGSHVNILALLLTLAAPFYLCTVLQSRAAVAGGAAIALFVIELAIFFTLARSAWAGQAAAVAVLFAGLWLANRPRRLLPRSAAVVGGLGIGLTVLFGMVVLLGSGRPIWLFRASLAPRSDMRSVGIQIFRQHLWWGAGPGSYALLYPLENGSYPEAAIHSHNVPVQIAADGGIAGLVAALMLLVSAISFLFRLWRRGTSRQRSIVATVAASFAAFLVDGIGDSPHLFSEVLLVLAALMAIAVRSAREDCAADHRPWSGYPSTRCPTCAKPVIAVVLLLLGSALCGLWLRIDQAGAHYARSLDLAAQSHWIDSVNEAERAIAIDPTLAIYHVQAGVALEQAWQVDGAVDGRERGIAELRQALALEPRSGVTRLDLAALLVSSDRNDEALALLPEIVHDAGRDPLLLLGDAVLIEQLQPDAAVESYAGLLVLNPSLAGSPFWQENGFRRQHLLSIVDRAVQRVDAVTSGKDRQSLRNAIELYSGGLQQRAPLPEGTDFADRVARGRLLVAEGAYRDAAGLLQQAVAQRPDDPSARIAVGELDACLGGQDGERRQWLAGFYLGDPSSGDRLGDSFPDGAVPPAIISRQANALLGIGLSRFFLAFQHYRFAYARREPLPIVLPGDWLNALPSDYYQMQIDLDRWRAAAKKE